MAVAIKPDPQDLDGILKRFRPSGDEPDARRRFLYFEGSLLAMRREYPQSIERLDELAKLDASSPEPTLRLAEVLCLSSQYEHAEKVFRAALEDSRSKDRRIWDRWLAVELVDLKRSPAEVMDRLPAASSGAGGENDYGADVLWLLHRHKAGEAIRIHCGGGEYQEPGGKLWGKDRFARGGSSALCWGGDVQGTEADPLYSTERSFPLEEAGENSDYAIPLPPGEYRVHLHFAEVYQNIKGCRRFDVLLEGKAVLDDFEPIETGFATAVEKIFDVGVADGILEIGFIHSSSADPPKVSAIEVERVE